MTRRLWLLLTVAASVAGCGGQRQVVVHPGDVETYRSPNWTIESVPYRIHPEQAGNRPESGESH